MDLIERISWLILGGAIGFVVGYIVGRLRDIKEELEEVENDVKRIRDERGIVRYPLVADVILFFVVAVTVFAAFSSQSASNKVVDLQEEQKRTQTCLATVLFGVVDAINERTGNAEVQANANIDAWASQLEFLTSLSVQPPLSEEEARANYDKYVASVQEYLVEARKARDKQIQNPYPTVEDLTACFTNGNSPE